MAKNQPIIESELELANLVDFFRALAEIERSLQIKSTEGIIDANGESK